MAYQLNSGVQDSPISSQELVSRTDRWNNNSNSGINDCFWKDQYLQEQQLMSDANFDGFLNQLHLTMSTQPTLRLHMAIGTQNRFRPWIEIVGSGTDALWRFELVEDDPAIEDTGARSPIPATGNSSASQFTTDFDTIDKDDLYLQFSYLDTPNDENSRIRVEQYNYSAADTLNIYNNAMASEYGKVKLFLFFGSGPEQAGDAGVSHPMDFRPVLDLKTQNLNETWDANYWDFSSPCPPNCSNV